MQPRLLHFKADVVSRGGGGLVRVAGEERASLHNRS